MPDARSCPRVGLFPTDRNHSFTREGGWVPREVARTEALALLPCIVNIGSHNFVCRTAEDERAVVDRCGIERLRWFVNGAGQTNYDGPDPSVECGRDGCTNRLRLNPTFGGEGNQFCCQEHRDVQR